MRAFIAACCAALIIAVCGAVILNKVNESAEVAYSTQGARFEEQANGIAFGAPEEARAAANRGTPRPDASRRDILRGYGAWRERGGERQRHRAND